MLINTGHLDWDAPLIWVNPTIEEDDNGMRNFPCRLISKNLKGSSGTVGYGVIVAGSDGTESAYVLDDKGWSDSNCKKKDGSTLKLRYVFNYIEEVPTSEKLGEF